MQAVQEIRGRRYLGGLIRSHGDRTKDLSRLLGRPAGYLGEHLRGAVELDREEIITLAKYYRVRPIEIGGDAAMADEVVRDIQRRIEPARRRAAARFGRSAAVATL